MGRLRFCAAIIVGALTTTASAFDGTQRRTFDFVEAAPFERLVVEPFTAHSKRRRVSDANGTAFLSDGIAVNVRVRRVESRSGKRVKLRIDTPAIDVAATGERVRGRIQERLGPPSTYRVRLKHRGPGVVSRRRTKQLRAVEHAPGSVLSRFAGSAVLTTGTVNDRFSDVGRATDGRVRIAGVVLPAGFSESFEFVGPDTVSAPATWSGDDTGIAPAAALPSIEGRSFRVAHVQFTTAEGPPAAAVGISADLCVPEAAPCTSYRRFVWLGGVAVRHVEELLPDRLSYALVLRASGESQVSDVTLVDEAGLSQVWSPPDDPIVYQFPNGADAVRPFLPSADGERVGGTFVRDEFERPAVWDADGVVTELALPTGTFAWIDGISPDGRYLCGGVYPESIDAGQPAIWDLDAPSRAPVVLASSGADPNVAGFADRMTEIADDGLAFGRSHAERIVWRPGWASARPFAAWLSEETGFTDDRDLVPGRIVTFADGWAFHFDAVVDRLQPETTQSYVAFIPRD